MSFRLPARIVVGLSFREDIYDMQFQVAENEQHLLQQTMWLADKAGAALHFVAVIEEPDEPIPGHATSVHEVLSARLDAALLRVVETAGEQGLTATHEIAKGAPALVLPRIVAERNADVLAISPRRADRTAFDRLIHGSTSERLLRKCPCPVWVVHPDGGEAIERIAVPVDFSSVSRQTIAIAREMHEKLGARVWVIHAPEYPAEVALRRLPDPGEAIDVYRRDVQTEVDRQLDELLGSDRSWCTVVIAEDWIVRALPELVQTFNIDLTIMGSVARTGIAGWFMGNTAEKVLRALSSSTWVVKPEGWTAPR